MHRSEIQLPANTSALRRSNIELLRILVMLLIVAHHFSIHGGFTFPVDTVSINRLWIQFIQLGGKLGVDVFVLISGYFLIHAESLKTNRIVRLWFQIFSYSIVIFAVFILTGRESFRLKELIKHLFPVTYTQWWFASSYFVLYLLHPFLNSFLKTLDRERYVKLLLLLSLCWCIIPTFLAMSFQSNYLLWFMFLYALAGYIRLYGFPPSLSAGKCLLLHFLCMLLTFGSAVVLDILGTRIPVLAAKATFFYDMEMLPIFLAALFLFLSFLKLDIGSRPLINSVSAAMFGVYLIHDHPYVRRFLWQSVFANAFHADSHLLIPYSLLVISLVFVGCTAIELFRIHVLEKLFVPVTDGIVNLADMIETRVLLRFQSRR